jgi:hypothetical protein
MPSSRSSSSLDESCRAPPGGWTCRTCADGRGACTNISHGPGSQRALWVDRATETGIQSGTPGSTKAHEHAGPAPCVRTRVAVRLPSPLARPLRFRGPDVKPCEVPAVRMATRGESAGELRIDYYIVVKSIEWYRYYVHICIPSYTHLPTVSRTVQYRSITYTLPTVPPCLNAKAYTCTSRLCTMALT